MTAFSTLLYEAGSLTGLEAHQFNWTGLPVTPWDQPGSTSLVLELEAQTAMRGISLHYWGLNIVPHDCMTIG